MPKKGLGVENEVARSRGTEKDLYKTRRWGTTVGGLLRGGKAVWGEKRGRKRVPPKGIKKGTSFAPGVIQSGCFTTFPEEQKKEGKGTQDSKLEGFPKGQFSTLPQGGRKFHAHLETGSSRVALEAHLRGSARRDRALTEF